MHAGIVHGTLSPGVELNPAGEKLLGYPNEQLIGKPTAEVTHPDDAAAFGEALVGLIAGNMPVLDAQQRYLRHGGEPVWLHANVAVMRDDKGAPSYLVVHLRDLTSQRQAEQAQQALNATLQERLEETTHEVEALNKQQEAFAYGISHDLRAPLRAIDSFATLLDNHCAAALDDTGRGYLDRIRAAATRMNGLIDALLELSRVGRVALKSEPVDLSLLAEWTGAELQEAEPGRAAQITVAPGLLARGDERLLKVLLTQLLHNAWKFSAGDAQVRIHVDGEVRDDRLQLRVRDHGSGFDMRYADKLFEPFQRLHGPEQAGGTGLGLAIAQRIVERHGGRLWVQSEPGMGSTFHVELPAAAA
ncbi:MAG: PAS domain S-box protein [Gammaproteobacteria bacterium]|nr:PAS domain S-box protein [Gammaproteobacteria bacterium]